MKRKLKTAMPIYRLIETNHGLEWLNQHYLIKIGAHRPLTEYKETKHELIFLNLIQIITTVYSIVGATYVVYLINHLGKESFMALVLSFAVIIYMAVVSAGNLMWSKRLVPIYITALWNTAEFTDDVQKLACFYSSENNPRGQRLTSQILELAGNGEEISSGSIPKHVKDGCSRLIFEEAKEIKKSEGRKEEKIDRKFAQINSIRTSKEILKRRFELCKRFDIFPQDADLRLTYSAAQAAVELEEFKKEEENKS